jgi:hypothetical protein
VLQALQQRCGRPPVDPRDRELARLEQEAQLRDQLARQAKVIEVQGELRAAGQARDEQRRAGRGGSGGQRAEQLMAALNQAVATLARAVGTVRACRAVGQPRSSWYRRHWRSEPPSRSRPVSYRNLERCLQRASAGAGGAAPGTLLGHRTGQRVRHAAG